MNIRVFLIAGCTAVILAACAETAPPPKPLPPAPVQEPVYIPPPVVAPPVVVPTAPPVPNYIFGNDEKSAFDGFDMQEVPGELLRDDLTEGQVTLALMNAYNLRELANIDGVQMWAKTRKADNGDILWGYEFWGLPDPSVHSEHYQALVQKTNFGLEVKVIGKRRKCVHAPDPTQWTEFPCP